MAAGAAVLGLPPPTRETFVDCAVAAVAAAGLGEARAAVRVTLTAGSGGRGLDRPAELRPRLFATAAPSPRPERPASLAIASVRRNEASPTSRLKTLAYLDNVLARREARDAGADEAVMLNTQGELACAAAANLFWIEAGALVTPADETGCLPGIMRAQVLDAARALGIETRAARAEAQVLERSEAMFLASSLIGVRPAHLLGRPSLRIRWWSSSRAPYRPTPKGAASAVGAGHLGREPRVQVVGLVEDDRLRQHRAEHRFVGVLGLAHDHALIGAITLVGRLGTAAPLVSAVMPCAWLQATVTLPFLSAIRLETRICSPLVG